MILPGLESSRRKTDFPRRIGRLAVASLAVVAWAGCRGPDSSPRPNVLIVLVDTLRADHMSTYDYERRTTPNVDEFARRAVVFRNNRSQATCTFPSVPSLLSSRYPFEFVQSLNGLEGLEEGGFRIPEDAPYLPKILKQEGYFTAAVSASPVITKDPSAYNKTGGFDPGFDYFLDLKPWSRASAVNRAVQRDLLERLRQSRTGDTPFFLYLHYTDPHDTYQSPEPYFSGTYVGENDFIARGFVNAISEWMGSTGLVGEARTPGPSPWQTRVSPWRLVTKSDVDHLVDLYDDEILFFDRRFGELLDLLRKEDLYENTLVVLASDHGEELLDHGHIKHCRPPPFDTLVRTPLIVKTPGGNSGAREHLSENLDIVPTILDYLGLEAGPYRLHGQSLRPSIESHQNGERFVYGSQFRYRFVANQQNKLIIWLDDGSTQLFDLVADPGEQESVEDSAIGEDLLARIDDWRQRVERGEAETDVIEMERNLENTLRAVGYVQ